ncbi:hypothetical protein CONPUDRAFT_158788 [Coniophora puteana RWD-64-598 SS2]|uniref:Uncharacterized protein n=1 Tax=Coniophora puteana (strain RWD-64-598) TaxID=741705 RepID=A0A5M3MBK5_CONPW|nr:uncharacterized protein CONPUDRAFT_158788 [Coniophora puteana RWD-64-598 SS2]EIW76011.1 hypothetical protein CONPUDRAFT_158788 [Coniophora puteana RWD-64-598 SS2]
MSSNSSCASLGDESDSPPPRAPAASTSSNTLKKNIVMYLKANKGKAPAKPTQPPTSTAPRCNPAPQVMLLLNPINPAPDIPDPAPMPLPQTQPPQRQADPLVNSGMVHVTVLKNQADPYEAMIACLQSQYLRPRSERSLRARVWASASLGYLKRKI